MPIDPVEALLIGGLGSGLGYLIGRGKYADWEDIVKAYNERISHLRYFRVIKPLKLFQDVVEIQAIHRQSVLAYLFGLPDASVSMSLRCLEVALTNAKTQIEKQEAKEGLADLINWAGKYLGSKKDIAHGFRILRNLIHEKTLVQEQDALETISHVDEIVNLLYPFQIMQLPYACPKCSTTSIYQLQREDFYLGNTVNLDCTDCQQSNPIFIL